MPDRTTLYTDLKKISAALVVNTMLRLDKMRACRLLRKPGDALQVCSDAMQAQEKSMNRALDAVEVARLCACWSGLSRRSFGHGSSSSCKKMSALLRSPGRRSGASYSPRPI